jgi:hypothetical protein
MQIDKIWLEKQSIPFKKALCSILERMISGHDYAFIPFNTEIELKLVEMGFIVETVFDSFQDDYITSVQLKND